MKVKQTMFWCLILLVGTGCDIAQELLGDLGTETGPNQLTDENAFRFIKKDRSQAPETDVSAVMKAIDLEKQRAMGNEMPMRADEDVVRILSETVRSRQTIDEDRFIQPDFFSHGAEEDWVIKSTEFMQNCNWELSNVSLMLRGDYLIPGVEKIPVRDQGFRGTCAAFAGIGMTEYAALNAANGGNPDLNTIDLSEQKFYYDSKPDCQDGSCPADEQGSWYGNGMSASVMADELNIPLEANCPYKNVPDDNDVQAPLATSCGQGSLKLEEMRYWCGINELIELLHEGYAVPYASPLSANWEANDGLITKADFTAEGSSVHAGGHAYLIVGYRELPEMPEEGGICFMVKNSWGEGWGVKGYSCMTLAWMNAVTYDGFLGHSQPVAIRVQLDDDLAASMVAADDMVDENEDIPDDTDRDLDEDEKGSADEIDLDPVDDETNDDTPPAPPEEMWVESRLRGPGDAYFKVEHQADEDEVVIRALLTGERGKSQPLTVLRNGSKLSFNGDIVGRFTETEIRLCTREFAALCSVRIREEDQQLYLQFRDDDLRRVKEDEYSTDKGDWVNLPFSGESLGVFVPKSTSAGELLFAPKTFVRIGGLAPVRLSLRPTNNPSAFSMRLGGTSVGQVDFANPIEGTSVCSGGFSNTCSLMVGERLNLIPRNSGRR